MLRGQKKDGGPWQRTVSGLQGLKPMKETQLLCRACPSFVRMKRHDLQGLRVFSQGVRTKILEIVLEGAKAPVPERHPVGLHAKGDE
jgi:hypothetical protein